MSHDPGMQRLAQALQDYEKRCHWLAEQAVDMFHTFAGVELCIMRCPIEGQRHQQMFISRKDQPHPDATLILDLKRGMSAEVMGTEIAAAARDHPVMPL